jgi:glucose-6-phosphate 1-dehydrogenase
MNDIASDAFVFFGATGDLAYKKIFPALYAMVRRGGFHIPVIGMARAGWNLDKLKARARDSVRHDGDFDEESFAKLAGLLRYVDGDYTAPDTLTKLKSALGQATSPIHYLAIPPSMFASVVQGLQNSGCAANARVIVDAIRDVVQNHLLQVVTLLAMDAPAGRDPRTMQAEKLRIFRAMRPLDPREVVRGQFRGYRAEQGVAPDSQIETFAALHLRIDTWRWSGVPFYIRAGKNLPITATEVSVTLQRPPLSIFDPGELLPANYFRLRLSPEVVIGAGALVKRGGEDMHGEPVELIARHNSAAEKSPYERLLADAVRGDTSLFTQDDCVEAAWRVVDPVLKCGLPVIEYEPGTWGPAAAAAIVAGAETWHDPQIEKSAPC